MCRPIPPLPDRERLARTRSQSDECHPRGAKGLMYVREVKVTDIVAALSN